MANIKISELNPLVTIQDADVLPIVDNAVTKKVTAAILRSYTEGNSVLLTGAQTVAGIKTFTSQLASTVATGTAPFSVASTTKVTNLNADLLDGLSSADFALSTRTLTAGTGLTGGGDLTANRTFAIDSTVATLTGTQTLTNKTITSPIINEILDSNGNEILGFTPIASATDYITIKNGIGVGVPLHISAAGSSTNTGLHLEPKGTGLVQISDGTDTTKGIRFRSSGSATSAITLIDAVSSAGRVITLPNATGTLALTSDLTAYVPTTRTVSTTSPLAGGGALSGDLTLSIPQATTSVNGYLSSADWTTFNNKQNALTNPITGTGTTNYLPKFTGASALGNSSIYTTGTNIAIGGTTAYSRLELTGPATAYSNSPSIIFSDNAGTTDSRRWLIGNVATTYGSLNFAVSTTNATDPTNSKMTITKEGNVGINTTTPTFLLDVVGTARISSDATINGVKVGRGAGNIATNTAVGASALNANTTGATNTAVGVNALTANTTGSQNTSVGVSSLSANNTGSQNTAIGRSALFTNTTGANNTALGYQASNFNSIGSNITALGAAALLNNTSSNNTAVGFEAATTNTSGTNITAIGYQALKASTGANNTALGFQSLLVNSTGTNNTALGDRALTANTTGITNTAIGQAALFTNIVGNNNTAIGTSALFTSTGSANTAIGSSALLNNTASNNTAIGFEAANANTSGDEITALGYRALKANTTGVSNTAFGSTALSANITGNCNTAIGSNAMNANTTGSNNNVIGYNQVCTNFSGVSMLGRSDTATGSNQMRFGSSAVNNGAVATEVVVSDRTWAVFINGVAYKILLKA